MSEVKFVSDLEQFEAEIKREEKQAELLGEITKEPERNHIKKIARKESFNQLKERALNDEDYRKKQHIKGSMPFYIGVGEQLTGQITFLEEKQRQKVVLCRIVRRLRDDESHSYQHYYFNEQIPQRDKPFKWDTIEAEFFIYTFKTADKRYKLFSEKPLEMGEYNIFGSLVELDDFADLGQNAQIGTKCPLLFCNRAFPKRTTIQDHNQLIERFKHYNLTEEKFINWLYTGKNGLVYEFPKSFCLMQISNLFASRDDYDEFHLPLMMISDTGTGKTTGTYLIYNKMGENEGYTDMTTNTLKGLVPSFKNSSDVKAGKLLSSFRYCPVDEFFSGVSNLHPEEKSKTLEKLKNLLDYSERSHSSGNGEIKGKMRAEHIVLTNPKGYGNNMLQLSNHTGFFPENLNRYLIWLIPAAQKEFIKENRGKLKKGDYSYIDLNDWLDCFDYLKTFNCDYDRDEVLKVFEIGEKFIKSKESQEYENLKHIYTSRYDIHCCRLLDSLVKLRCLCEGDTSFKANSGDYERLKNLWVEMLQNWGIGFENVSYEDIA